MKAFLSHSSKDKGFVDNVCELLRPGHYEIDSETFDKGLLNSQAVLVALRRSDLFCLMVSRDSLNAAFVEFETRIAVELLASGKLAAILIICLDESAFATVSVDAKMYNIVRKVTTPEAAARLIEGKLLSAVSATRLYNHPFIGRTRELTELETQASDINKPPIRALFISGNYGSGRRTIARKFYEDQFPHVGKLFPTIQLDHYSGYEELYRKILAGLRPTMSVGEMKKHVQGFQVSTKVDQGRIVAQLINSALADREAVILVDTGGALTDQGALTTELNEAFGKLETKPHPPLVIVSPRMIPKALRRPQNDMAYLAVKSLDRDNSRQLLSRLLKGAEVQVSDEELESLVDLSDGHPLNAYQLLEEVSTRGVGAFLANPGLFNEWKHRQSSEYLSRINLDEAAILILALLRNVPQVDFSGVVDALNPDFDAAKIAECLYFLEGNHVIERNDDRYSVSPAVRIAVEKDARIKVTEQVRKRTLESFSKRLVIRLEDGSAQVSLIDAAVIASIESGSSLGGFGEAFLLPSHYVWLSKRYYDSKSYKECVRLCAEALKGRGRLSTGGLVAACRFLCLSSARLGDIGTFEDGIKMLKQSAADPWASSNIYFLLGFNARLNGHLPVAEEQLRKSYELSPGNSSAARELAGVCLERGNLEEAEKFAREAYAHGPHNPYLIDMLISVLIKKYGNDNRHEGEIRELFDVLESVGEEGGKSFFSTRKAEFEHLYGDNRKAKQLIDSALKKTPSIFEANRLQVEILLKDGNRPQAYEVLSRMKEKVESRDPEERRSNYRSYLVTLAHYYEESGRFEEAKQVYSDDKVFTNAEKDQAVRDIEIGQAYAKKR